MGFPTSTSWTLLRKLGESPADRSAWEIFVLRYGPAVFQWCRQWGLQEADANDVTQNVLLKLTEHMKVFQYDASKSFRAWLKTVSYHVWAKWRDARQNLAVGTEDIHAALQCLEAKEDLATRLEREYDGELLEMAMMRVSQRVESHTWEAFRLLALQGLPGAEVARRMNLRVATAYVARSKVQRMIQEEIRLLENAQQEPEQKES
jgi:RNA polymerase sigma-70 factor (ECF subfamily)